jgi:penicillin amidase
VPTFRRRVLRALYLLLPLPLLAIAAGWAALHASLPALDGQSRVRGLEASVRVERDALGTVTIRAASRRDAAFALGFVHAQERYFEMDLMRRLAAGELAELVGSAALDADRQHRPFRMRARAQATLAALPPADRDLLATYGDGVNAGLAALRARPWEYWLLGLKPAPWSAVDSILVIDAMFFDLNGADNARELGLAKLRAALGERVYRFLAIPGGPWDAPLIGPPLPDPTVPGPADLDLRTLDRKWLRIPAAHVATATIPGSNGFAVHGNLTASHAALIAGDMHLNLRVPNLWFRARLLYPSPRHQGDTVDAIGITLPGVPGLVVGSNRHIAWTFTNSYGDWMDWVRVLRDPADPNRYRTADGERAIEQTEEIIRVRHAPEQHLTVRDTVWGPILATDTDGTPLALAWTALRPDAVNLELDRLDTAESVDEAIAIANRAGLPPQNFVVGDRAGNIGWTIAGRIPKREGTCDPGLPCDWSAPNTGWNGWLEPEQYPRLPNPPWQRIWTANSRTLDWQGADYAKLGDGGYDLGARARQIRDDLFARQRFSPQDMLAIQLDDHARLLEHWHARLGEVLLHAGNHTTIGEMQKYLVDWNGRADPASVGYRLTREFRTEVIDTVLDGFAAAVRARTGDPEFHLPHLSQAETVVETLLVERPRHLLPPGYADWDELLQRCAERVGTRLAALPGGIARRTYGEINATHITHPLSPALPGLGRWLDMPRRELPGDSNLPRVQAPEFGASERFAVEPGHEETGYFHMPGGQSDNPLSPFYGAGDADWAEARATPFLPGSTMHTLILAPPAVAAEQDGGDTR